jgi:hypothetical protein
MKNLFITSIFFALALLFMSCGNDSFYGSAAGGGGTGPSPIDFHDLKAFSQGTQVGGKKNVLYRPTQTQYGIVWDKVELIPGGLMCGWSEPIYFEDASDAASLNMTLQHASARLFTSVVFDLYAQKSLDSWVGNITVYSNHQIVVAGCRCNDIPCWQSDGAFSNGFFKEEAAEEEVLHDTPPPPTK